MWITAQILIDIVFGLGILILAAAHLAGRNVGDELDVVRDAFERDLERLEGRINGGAKPK
ncbi:MAG TPA: hypothetical protein VFP92_00835 [Rhodanobacteraceae bacterium]|nr:hypothetical protein [Rhodanobacteraceae bacterium]